MTDPNRGHRDTIHGRGEKKLRHALGNLRRPPSHPQPISIEPSNPRECNYASSYGMMDNPASVIAKKLIAAVYLALLIERLRQLEADIQELKARVNWLILAIVGACLTFIVKTLFA